ncbi:hypothetical protein LZG04_27015 [Saccharothrix sp. S26]|uniref:hypothetical protein n=1 Tax=Saccharothrix sp. S26 TaxID=2907215 RepID=UPI001F419950|nr:hypothetical protein [Saccharothrix sp. S26]MCE6998424.1 hypothetical protein [Saccharothrix sp. S26]
MALRLPSWAGAMTTGRAVDAVHEVHVESGGDAGGGEGAPVAEVEGGPGRHRRRGDGG